MFFLPNVFLIMVTVVILKLIHNSYFIKRMLLFNLELWFYLITIGVSKVEYTKPYRLQGIIILGDYYTTPYVMLSREVICTSLLEQKPNGDYCVFWH